MISISQAKPTPRIVTLSVLSFLLFTSTGEGAHSSRTQSTTQGPDEIKTSQTNKRKALGSGFQLTMSKRNERSEQTQPSTDTGTHTERRVVKVRVLSNARMHSCLSHETHTQSLVRDSVTAQRVTGSFSRMCALLLLLRMQLLLLYVRCVRCR